MQVTQAVAARYIVLWRVIRVVDCRALVIDFHAARGARAAGWLDLERRRPLLEWAKYNPAFSVSR